MATAVEGDEVRIFKFMSSKYAQEFISGKSIRVGTLEDFRREFEHQATIGDGLEGTSVRNSGRKHVSDIRHDPEYFARLARQAGIVINVPGANVTIENNTFHVQAADCYLMSFSKLFDSAIWSALPDDYDIALVVEDAELFTDCLTKALEKLVTGRRRLAAVEYVELRTDLTKQDAPEPSPFLKDIKFSGQQEFRIGWQAKQSSFPLKPTFVTCDMPTGLISIFAKR